MSKVSELAELKARRAELKSLLDWEERWGSEAHVSHLCPPDSVDCAMFKGRMQKLHQYHNQIINRIAEIDVLIKEAKQWEK